ncbi:MAG: C39 family peptidase [Anaerolineaceae bacterium]
MQPVPNSHYKKWIVILVILIMIGFTTLFIMVNRTLQAEEQLVTPLSTISMTATVIPATITPIPPTATVTPVTPTPTAILPTITTVVIPESYYIMDITGTGQYFALGCEASAAVDWANYFGVFIYEYNFQTELPVSDNPDLGFVGLVTGPWGQVPPYAYGVHADPVAALLRKYGLPAISGKGYTLDQVREKLAQSKPIIAWVIGNMVGGIPSEYVDKQGNVTIVAAYEHVVILTGYDQDSIRYMNNGRFYEVPNEVFLNSWGVLGNMAVMAE